MKLQTAYFALGILMTGIVIWIGIRAIKRTFGTGKKVIDKSFLLIMSLLLWHMYVFVIAKTGILQDYSLPPKTMLLVLPSYVFIGVFLYRNRNRAWIHKIPQHWLIFYQSFRIVIETIFIFAVAQNVMHYYVTIEGYNYDLLYAITAPFVGCYVWKKKSAVRRLAIWWNYFGLLVIAIVMVIATTTIYYPEFYGYNYDIMPKKFVMYPYVLTLGFLMPSALFVHLLSLIQLHKSKRR